MDDFLDNPRKWSVNNVNLIIGFLFCLAVPFTAWILLFGFFSIKCFKKFLFLRILNTHFYLPLERQEKKLVVLLHFEFPC